MPDSTAVYVRRLIDMLLERGYLIADPDRMNVLVLARTGNALMRGRGEFRVKLPKEKKAGSSQTVCGSCGRCGRKAVRCAP